MTQKVFKNFEKDVYQKYYPLVLSNCKRRLYDSHAIEDAVQSTFLIYIKEEANIRSHLSSWLYWTSTNVCKVLNNDIKKTNKIISDQNEENANVWENSSDHQEHLHMELKKALDKLPQKKQEMLLMRFFDEMSYRQIALHFKSTEDAVRKMIEHTLGQLKEKINKNDVAFSVLFMEFFNKKAGAEIVNAALSAQTKGFILQNTIKQQLIVSGVQKMLFYAKVKYAVAVCACILLPFSAVVVAESKIKKTESNLMIDKTVDSANEKKNKNLTVKEEKKPEVKSEVKPEVKPDIKAEVKKENSYLGVWKLQSKSSNYPHQIGSTLTINADGSFLITAPNAKGIYTAKDGVFTFNFGGNMVLPFKYMLEEKKLSFEFIGGKMTMEYIKE